ncbi:MAG: SDR family NAD(P)-dependent oxidoreductase [Steroidobacteraceae bacterium]
MKTWFITGVSRGLGKALAKAALEQGDIVVGTVRNGSLEPPTGLENLQLLTADLADGAAAEAAIRTAFERLGRIDVIVNNAGYGLLGALEQATDAEVERLFNVDFFSPFRIIRTALPHLRSQGSGHIVNITSIAGRAPSIGSALYSSAKYALEGMSAALALEVRQLGIKVTAVAPGAFRTDFLDEQSIRNSASADAAYADSIGRSLNAFAAANRKQLGNPDCAAQIILEAVNAKDPPLHLLLGSDALRRAREKLDAVIFEMDAWEERSRSTDFASN